MVRALDTPRSPNRSRLTLCLASGSLYDSRLMECLVSGSFDMLKLIRCLASETPHKSRLVGCLVEKITEARPLAREILEVMLMVEKISEGRLPEKPRKSR